MSAHAALADDASAPRLARPRREFDVIDGLAGSAAAYADGPAAAAPLTAEAVGRVVAAAVMAFLLERFPAGVGISSRLGHLELDQLAAELDTALAQARRDLDGLALPAGPAATLADGGICAMFAVDIAGFTRPGRDDDIRRHVHEQLYEMQRKAFDGAGVPWARCWHEDRGDGTLVVLPPGLSGQGLVGSVPERLRGLVRRHNHVSCEAARIQLRTAAHVGLVEHDGHGFVGSDVNLLFRMLDSGALKRALAGSRADLALIVSDYVYGSLVRRHPSLVGPDAFEAVRCQVKKARFRAWTCLPGRL